MTFGIEKNILGFQIACETNAFVRRNSTALTIDDLQGMEILKGERDFTRVEKSSWKIERRLAPHVGKQFAARHVVEKHVEKLLRSMCPMQMDDERVLNGQENFFLALHMFRLQGRDEFHDETLEAFT